jgi:hypothetical protein
MQASKLTRIIPFVFIRDLGRKIFVSLVQFVVFIILVVMKISQKALPYHVLVFTVAIVSEGLDGNAPARIKQSYDFQILRFHQFDQVLHNDVHAILVEVAVVAETEEVEFQALALYHKRARYVINNKVSEIGLACFGTK